MQVSIVKNARNALASRELTLIACIRSANIQRKVAQENGDLDRKDQIQLYIDDCEQDLRDTRALLRA